MAKLVLSLGLVVLLHLPSLGQVDTLRVAQVAELSSPGGVNSLYFKSLRGNDTLYIVISTNTNIYVYRGIDTSLIWTSPYSYTGNHDIQFYDMNNDGDLDIAYRDTSGFYIYDVLDTTLIWSDRNLKDYLYGLGDRNSDGVGDIIAMRRQPFEPSHTDDTVYVEIYDGPNYQLTGQFNFTVIGYHVYEPAYGYLQWAENPAKVIFADLMGSTGIQHKIIIFTSIDMEHYECLVPGVECLSNSNSGNIKIIDPLNFNMININSGSLSPLNNSLSVNDSSYLDAITQDYASSVDLAGHICSDHWGTNKYSLTLSADRLINSNRFYHYAIDRAYISDWQGFQIGDIDIDSLGKEICFGDRDTLWLLSYPSMTPLWVHQAILGDDDYPTGIYHSNILFEHPQILVQSRFNPPVEDLYDGSTGELSGIILGNVPEFQEILDINNDGEDELFAAYWFSSNSVSMYRLELAPTEIDYDGNILPSSYRLYPNYPNPFNPSTTIQYDLIKESPVDIGIYDILGRRIATLINQKQPAGHHQVIWNATDISSGIYFYKIQAGNFSETKKMLMLK